MEYLYHLHSFPQTHSESPFPGFPLPHLMYSFNRSLSPVAAAHILMSVTSSTVTVNIRKATPLKKIDFLPRNHQLSIAPCLGVGTSVALPYSHWNVDWLHLVSCTGGLRCYEFVSETVLPCPEHTALPQSSLTSLFLRIILLSFLWQSLSLVEEEYDINVPHYDWALHRHFSSAFGPVVISVLAAIYCTKRLLWWGLIISLIYEEREIFEFIGQLIPCPFSK